MNMKKRAIPAQVEPIVMPSVEGLTSQGIIFIRYYGGTYIARFQGKTASCTGGKKQAAERVARKVMGERKHTVEMCGNEYAWEILA
jgi:hypothetical protein